MITRFYAFMWLLVIVLSTVMFFAAGFSEMTLTIFGFVVSTLGFAGIVAVLPWWVDQRYTWKYQSR